ncbi:MAG: thioredoxin family protein [Thermodesulfobacteriota bacterium]
MKKIRMMVLGLFAVLAIIGAIAYHFNQEPAATASSHTSAVETVPVEGVPTMVDLGATECIPCKMMAPILTELEKEYAGKAAIVFIDVWKNPGEAKKFGIRAIPTQIFYDEDGKEVYRHTGFMDKKSIVKQLQKLGVG